MVKKLILSVLTLLVLAAAFLAWRFLLSNTPFSEKQRYLYIRTAHATYPDVLQSIRDSQLVSNPGSFNWLAKQMDVPEKIKAGRYEIRKGMSLLDIVRMLRNGRQSPVNLVITKLRTKENLAGMVGRRFECDSASMMAFLNNNDSLSTYDLDSNTVMTAVYPDTYTYFWNTTPSAIFKKFAAAYKKVWTPERIDQAKQHGLTPSTAYILASIVEEETRVNKEKGNIASVYLNRYNKGMRLQADPTVKFALRDFGLRRIYEKHLTVESPYNTYRVTGWPPGPICTPSMETLDAVLQSPSTNYVYFVANSDFSGSHLFSETYEQHLQYRKAFSRAQDSIAALKQAAKEDIDATP